MHTHSHYPLVAALVLLFLAGVAMAQQQTATQRTPFFENEEVKVWKTRILTNQPLAMHRHEYPRVIIALAGGTLKVVPQSGAAHSLDWETGKAYWLEADPPGQLHADVNPGEKPIEVVVVELKKAK